MVVPELRDRGHQAVAVDLPSEDESAGWWQFADAVADAVGLRRHVIVVGHSLAGFTAPLVCARIPADLLVLVAAMIPSPGELLEDWWANAGYEESGLEDVFYHDVPPDLAVEAKRRERHESAKALREPWPLDAWPETPTRYLLCRRRPHVHGRMGAAPRSSASRDRCRRDGRGPLHRPQPSARAGRTPRRIRRDPPVVRRPDIGLCFKASCGGRRTFAHDALTPWLSAAPPGVLAVVALTARTSHLGVPAV